MIHEPFTARVVIVGRTKMGKGLCIGGLIDPTGQPVRLLPRNRFCHPPSARFEVGEVWSMTLRARTDPEPPHTEDHDEWDAKRIGRMPKLDAYLARAIQPTHGDVDQLFGSTLQVRKSGSAFLPRNVPEPAWSVEFWRPPFPLTFEAFGDKVRYHTADGCFRITHVGCQAPVKIIPAGALVRISLARWWINPEAPKEGETCSLQLSGWFGLEREELAMLPSPPSVREADVPH